MDLFDRETISYTIGISPNLELSTTALREYLSCLQPDHFFGHLKEELFHHVRFISIDTLAAQLNEYIRWHNTERISTKLEGLSPVHNRTQAFAA